MRRNLPAARSARAAGALLVLGMTALGLSAPAQAAEEPVFTLGGPADVALHPYPESGAPKASGIEYWLDDPRTGEEPPEFEYRVRVDAGDLKGVATVTVTRPSGAKCPHTGTVWTCEDYGPLPGRNEAPHVKVVAARGSKVGASGSLKVTGEADGARFTPVSTTVTVGGADLVVKKLPQQQELAKGQVYRPKVAFTNRGGVAADGVLLSFHATHGMRFPDRFGNCAYSEGGADFAPSTEVLCRLTGRFEPGVTYGLDVPLRVRASKAALNEIFGIGVHEDTAASRASLRGGAHYTQGSGATLKAVAAPATRAGDLDPSDNSTETDIRVANTADFAVFGDAARAAAGDSVRVKVGFRNRGPAWVANLRSGEPVTAVDVRIPRGARVTKKPAACIAREADGSYREKQLGAPRYVCATDYWVLDGAKFGLPFTLAVDEVVPDAEGTVALAAEGPGVGSLDFDPEKGNNAAKLVLNASDESASGGTDGGAGASPSPTASPSAGATHSSGGSSATGAQGGAAPTGGGLAATGAAGTPLVAGAALVALCAGGGLVLAARRRRSGGGSAL
ncbi:peptidase [Streptomyces sp. NPDC059740]|uniref:peptidase n=1 Tax=Streptomyces sp. NPDC059740 TaxID=3346926 RepID=UPI00365F645A